MIESVAKELRKYNWARQIYRVIKGIDFLYSIPQIVPIKIIKSRFPFKRINLVIPSINKEHLFGGASTALDLFNAIANQPREKFSTRILLTDAVPNRDDLEKFPHHHMVSSEEDSDGEHQILPVVHKYQKNVFVAPKDRFLSTSWWTAYATIHMVSQQSAEMGRQCNRMGYLIQDYEPGFYNWSSHFILAESTYRSNVFTIPIFNSTFLRDYFNSKGYRFETEFVFEPRLNPVLKQYLTLAERNIRDKKILIYGRPSVSRNCFTLIVEALKIWSSLEPSLKEWEVISIGESHKPVTLGNGKVLKSLGKLSLEAYAELLSRSAIGLSLMVSPHPSYPPLEMAHFGLLTITNSFANKNLSLCHENIFSLDNPTPDHIAEALLSSIRRFSKDPNIGLRGKSKTPDYCNNPEMFPFAEVLSKILFSTL